MKGGEKDIIDFKKPLLLLYKSLPPPLLFANIH